jgi:hypothetical protein
MNTTLTRTVRDRNLIAFLIARGFTCDFTPRNGTEELDARFPVSCALERACQEYAGNHPIPVQSFVAACRIIGEQIRAHRQRRGGQL